MWFTSASLLFPRRMNSFYVLCAISQHLGQQPVKDSSCTVRLHRKKLTSLFEAALKCLEAHLKLWNPLQCHRVNLAGLRETITSAQKDLHCSFAGVVDVNSSELCLTVCIWTVKPKLSTTNLTATLGKNTRFWQNSRCSINKSVEQQQHFLFSSLFSSGTPNGSSRQLLPGFVTTTRRPTACWTIEKTSHQRFLSEVGRMDERDLSV